MKDDDAAVTAVVTDLAAGNVEDTTREVNDAIMCVFRRFVDSQAGTENSKKNLMITTAPLHVDRRSVALFVVASRTRLGSNTTVGGVG